MITVEQARQYLADEIQQHFSTQSGNHQQLAQKLQHKTVAIEECDGLILAEDIISPMDVPPADNSAMDGYAVRLGDIVRGQSFEIGQRVIAGDDPEHLITSVARIFTGAEIPQGADTVIIQENAQAKRQNLSDESLGEVTFASLPERGANIRRRGQDINSGSCILAKGHKLNPARLGLLASLGISHVKVYQPLKVAVLSSGNELITPGKPLKAGQIYNSNAVLLKTLLEKDGFECVACEHVVDDRRATEQAIEGLLAKADVLLCTGGVSVGEEDHVGHVLNSLGDMLFWKLAIKPGKPLAFAKCENSFCFGLPGNPVSGFVTYQILVRKFLKSLQGEKDFELRSISVPLAQSLKTGRREEYFRASLVRDDNGAGLGNDSQGNQLHETSPLFKAELFANQSSGVLSSVAFSHGLLRVPANSELQQGDYAEFIILD